MRHGDQPSGGFRGVGPPGYGMVSFRGLKSFMAIG